MCRNYLRMKDVSRFIKLCMIFFRTEKQNSKIRSKYNQCTVLAYLMFENAVHYPQSTHSTGVYARLWHETEDSRQT